MSMPKVEVGAPELRALAELMLFSVLFLDFITIPIFADFSSPGKVARLCTDHPSFVLSGARLFQQQTGHLIALINTPDNETIDAWLAFKTAQPFFGGIS
jgi:hypothetical protein